MAETVKFTEARVAAIRARVKSGRVEFQDEELPALRLRVSPTSAAWSVLKRIPRSEEHTSELQSLMRISYAVFCLKKKKKLHHNKVPITQKYHTSTQIG